MRSFFSFPFFFIYSEQELTLGKNLGEFWLRSLITDFKLLLVMLVCQKGKIFGTDIGHTGVQISESKFRLIVIVFLLVHINYIKERFSL